VKKAGIANLLGTMGGQENSSGDTQKKLDVLSDEVFINCLNGSQKCAVLVTEEQELPLFMDPKQKGQYIVTFDPLDGSSNIDANVSIGSIFAVWKRKTDPSEKVTEEDYLRNGNDIVAAGYCLYGSGTVFTLAIKDKVAIFTLDPSLGEFVLSHKNVKMPD
jgi:fructose-1,6-bisphosphatase I